MVKGKTKMKNTLKIYSLTFSNFLLVEQVGTKEKIKSILEKGLFNIRTLRKILMIWVIAFAHVIEVTAQNTSLQNKKYSENISS